MTIKVLTKNQYDDINNAIQQYSSNKGVIFGYEDDGDYYFDDETVSDIYQIIDPILNMLYGGTRSNFLSSLPLLSDSQPKIYDLVKDGIENIHFHAINYKTHLTSSLYQVPTFLHGDLIKMEYYSDMARTNLILIVDVSYQRDSERFYTLRDTVRTWVNRDGTMNPNTKHTQKNYTFNWLGQMNASRRRRSNVVHLLQREVANMIIVYGNVDYDTAIAYGNDFLDAFNVHIDSFLRAPDARAFQLALEAEDENTTQWPWLFLNIDPVATVRDYILAELDYG